MDVANTASDNDDFITTSIYDTKVDARAGDDQVIVGGSGTLVLGNIGDDWLSVNLHRTAYEEMVLSTDLRGGVGDDFIQASLSLLNYDIGYETTLTANVEGGAGDDLISLDLSSSDAPITATVNGGSGNDTISVTFGFLEGGMGTLTEDLSLWGGAGDDTINVNLYLSNSSFPELDSPIFGGAGDDTITAFVQASGNDGGEATSRIIGGSGDDTIRSLVEGVETGFGGVERNVARGGLGDDRIEVTARGTNDFDFVANHAEGGDGDDVIVARGGVVGDMSESGNTLLGGSGNDHLTARLEIGYYGNTALNTVRGEDGDDVLVASIKVTPGWTDNGATRSELFGGEGADHLSVRGGVGNVLTGNQGDDTLIGGGGTDRLVGGQGADYLRGGGGSDTFVFMSARGEGLAERDQIADFTIGKDRIDVSRIDADAAHSGNQAFSFGHEDGAGNLWVTEDGAGDGSLLYADTGDGLLVVALLEGRAADFSAGDFIL
jgi:Ca2+-binding RTX toxin-like protein